MEEQQDGQVLPLVALLMLFAAVAAVMLGRLAIETSVRARATTAADAAALAGVIEGEAGAERVAAANDAQVIAFEQLAGGDVRVRVVHRGVEATARARAEGCPDAGCG